jgi:hypothetical protein
MELLGGFTQEKLTEIWDSLDSDTPNPTAGKVVDDEVEQVMTISTTQGQVSVSRKPGETWSPTPTVGENKSV